MWYIPRQRSCCAPDGRSGDQGAEAQLTLRGGSQPLQHLINLPADLSFQHLRSGDGAPAVSVSSVTRRSLQAPGLVVQRKHAPLAHKPRKAQIH